MKIRMIKDFKVNDHRTIKKGTTPEVTRAFGQMLYDEGYAVSFYVKFPEGGIAIPSKKVGFPVEESEGEKLVPPSNAEEIPMEKVKKKVRKKRTPKSPKK